jgi:hypothetical protein
LSSVSLPPLFPASETSVLKFNGFLYSPKARPHSELIFELKTNKVAKKYRSRHFSEGIYQWKKKFEGSQKEDICLLASSVKKLSLNDQKGNSDLRFFPKHIPESK